MRFRVKGYYPYNRQANGKNIENGACHYSAGHVAIL